MRVAYLSPLPPQHSGIADYSAELLPHLARHLQLEVFTDRPADSRLLSTGSWPVGSVNEFLSRPGSFDVTLYQLGNNADFHGSIFGALCRHPGVVVLHEYMLHHLIQGLTLSRGDSAGYVEEMRYCYGATGQGMAQRLLDIGLPIDVWRYPLFERVIDRSLGVIVHNQCTRRRVASSRPSAVVELIPHHLALDQLGQRDGSEIRARFGIPADAFLVASFGFMTPQKRLEVSLSAFAELRRKRPESRYLLAGDVSPYYDMEALLDGDRGAGVVMTGRLGLADLLAAMQACDVAINLRYPSGGETSGTLMRLMGLGKPVIVSDEGSFAEVPEGCCVKLEIGDMEAVLLSEYLCRLADDPELGRAMGRNARRHMERSHSLEGSAAAYAAFLERIVNDPPRLQPAVPPLAPGDARPAFGALTAAVGQGMADLGIDDADVESELELARILVDLDIDLEGSSPLGGGRRPA